MYDFAIITLTTDNGNVFVERWEGKVDFSRVPAALPAGMRLDYAFETMKGATM